MAMNSEASSPKSNVASPAEKQKEPADGVSASAIRIGPGADGFTMRAEGRVTVIWGQLFVHHHFTVDQRSLIFDEIAPSALASSHKADMYNYFGGSFANHQIWLNQMKLFRDQWLSSA